MMLDGAFPFVGVWKRSVAALDQPPTHEWLGDLPRTCETTMEMVWLLLQELWWVLRMRITGRGKDIILHVAETLTSERERNLRVPTAWY